MTSPHSTSTPTSDPLSYAPDVDLAKLSDRVAAHLGDARRAYILAHFAAGDAVHLIRYAPDRASTIDRLAERLLVDRSGLMRIARTAERIVTTEREALLALVDDRGWPLTWSHLSALACLSSRSARTRVAHAAVEGRLSVKDLRGLIAKEMVSKSSG